MARKKNKIKKKAVSESEESDDPMSEVTEESVDEDEATSEDEQTEEQDDTDSDDEDSDDDSDDDSDEDESGGDDDEEEEELVDKYDERGFLINDPGGEDYAMLMALNEVERESKLFDRVQERKTRMDRRIAVSDAKTAKKKKKTKEKRLTRAEKAKQKKAEDAKKGKKRTHSDALADLANRRKGKGRKKQVDEVDLGDESEEMTDDDMMNDAQDDGGRPGRHKRRKRDHEEDVLKSYTRTPMRLRDVKLLQLRRVQVEQICREPYFNEYAQDMFCRVSVGQRSNGDVAYRCAQIVKVDQFKKSYSFAKGTTSQGLLLRIGKAEKIFPFSILSNSSVLDSEFALWREQHKKGGLEEPSSEEILSMKKEKDALRENFVYTPELVKELLEKKKQSKDRFKHVNLGVTKMQLLADLELATQEGDEEEMRRLNKELSELADYESKRNSANNTQKVAGILSVNEKRIQETLDNARRGHQRELQNIKEGKKKFEATMRSRSRPVAVFSVAKPKMEKKPETPKNTPKMKKTNQKKEVVVIEEFDFTEDEPMGEVKRLNTFTFDTNRTSNADTPSVASLAFYNKVHGKELLVDVNGKPAKKENGLAPPPAKLCNPDKGKGEGLSINQYWVRRQ